VPIDPEPTRQRLIDTATLLLAERGVDGVSLAEINREAGQRNASALHYHFGGKDALLRALLAPYAAAVRDRRRALIDAATATGPPTCRQAVEVLVRPHAELATGDRRSRALTRIVADLFTDPRHSYEELDDLLGERAREEMTVLLVAALPELPPRIRAERLLAATAYTVHASSDRARRHSGPTDTDDFFIENLIDMVQGSLAAPVSAAARRGLPHT
jgi:AcrR family transcriptional regulator